MIQFQQRFNTYRILRFVFYIKINLDHHLNNQAYGSQEDSRGKFYWEPESN